MTVAHRVVLECVNVNQDVPPGRKCVLCYSQLRTTAHGMVPLWVICLGQVRSLLPAGSPITWKPQGPLALLLWVWILRTASDMLVLVSAWVKKSKEGKAAIIFLSEPNTLKMASAFSDLRRNR